MDNPIKIGFIDYYLDEWHANNYPAFIKKASGGKMEAAYAYGHIDSPHGGRTTDAWCGELGLTRCQTIDELISKSDCLLVLSPDNPEMHWELCQKPLRSGKRVYVDKTFAPTVQIAKELFKIADEFHTPMYSSSALRYGLEYEALPEKEADFFLSCGPGNPENYLIHQFEPMVSIMKARGKEILFTGVSDGSGAAGYQIAFEGSKRGSVNLMGWGAECPFSTVIRYADGTLSRIADVTAYFDRFIENMIRFFETGEGAVDKAQTISVMALLEAAHQAEKTPGVWVAIND